MRWRRWLLVLLLLWGRPVWSRVPKKASRSCLDLPEELLEQMFGRLSVGVLSAFHHALQLEPRGPAEVGCPGGGGGGHAHHHNNNNNNNNASRATPTPTNMLSISPWAYRLTYDPARYPRYIPEAYCLCEACLLGPAGRPSRRHRSAPVYAPSVILRRTGACVGGRHVYAEVYVSVPVGCTCVPLLDDERKDERQQHGNQSLSGGGGGGGGREGGRATALH